MYLFLLLVIPCTLVLYSYTVAPYRAKEFIPVYTFGFISAAVMCTIKQFFIFSNHIWVNSFSKNFFYLYAHNVFLPFVLLFALFFLCTIKTDDKDYRFLSFFPLMMSFYAVYLPYSIISMQARKSFFIIFAKPLLILAMCYVASQLLFWAYKLFAAKKSKEGVLVSAILLLVSTLPSLIEMMWYFKINVFAVVVVSLVQLSLPLLYYIFFQKENSKLKGEIFSFAKNQ